MSLGTFLEPSGGVEVMNVSEGRLEAAGEPPVGKEDAEEPPQRRKNPALREFQRLVSTEELVAYRFQMMASVYVLRSGVLNPLLLYHETLNDDAMGSVTKAVSMSLCGHEVLDWTK